MSITIPQGGTVAGQSANIQVQTPDIGGFVAQVGSAVSQKMGQIKDRQRAVMTEKIRLDATRELGQERLRFEQMTDPAQIEAEWPAVEAGIRDKYLKGTDANGRPLLTPEEADTLALSFESLGTNHALALGERSVRLTDSQEAAALSEAQRTIETEAASADPDTLEALLQFGKDSIARVGGQTGKTAEQVLDEQRAFEASVMNARLIGQMSSDPAGALAALNAGEYDSSLGVETVAQRKATAEAAVATIADKEAKAAEAAAKTRTDEIGKALDTMADGLFKGRVVKGTELLDRPTDEMLANPKWPRTKAAYELSRETPNLMGKTVAELDALIVAEQKRPVGGEAWENERLTVLIELRDKKAAAQATDPKGAARDAGIIPAGMAELPDFDPANPDPWITALAASISTDAHLRDKGHATTSAIFTAGEKSAVKAAIAPEADPATKVALMGAILAASDGNPAPVLTALEADPVFSRGLKFLGLTGNSDLVTEMLRGQQKMGADTYVAFPRKDQNLLFDELTGGVYEDAPVKVREEIMAAAEALYADGAKGIDPTDDPGAASTLYETALKSVIGGQADRNGDMTIGGLQEVNGSLTVLPVGISAATVDSTFEKLTENLGQIDPGWLDQKVQLGPDVNPADDTREQRAKAAYAPFEAASVGGGLPDLGNDPAGRMGTLTLRRVGESDVYELVREVNGRVTPIPVQGQDYAYRFRLKDLVFGAQP